MAYEPERSRMMQTRDYQPRTLQRGHGGQHRHGGARPWWKGAYGLSRRVLAMNEDLLRSSALDLLEHETMSGGQLDAISTVVNRAAVEPARLPAPRAAE